MQCIAQISFLDQVGLASQRELGLMPSPSRRILLGNEGVCELYGLYEVHGTRNDMFGQGPVKTKFLDKVGNFPLAKILDRLKGTLLGRIEHG